MVLTKDELIASLQNEVRILLHLISKVDPAKLDYRPTASQRSTLELLQYLSMAGPIQVRGVAGSRFDAAAWEAEETKSKARNLEEIQEAIAKQSEDYAEVLAPLSEEALREPVEMFGYTSSRGSWLVSLVLCNHTAYRMQLFLYLKSSGREELNTMNLWVGVDGAMTAA